MARLNSRRERDEQAHDGLMAKSRRGASSHPREDILDLQRSAGNRAVGQLLSRHASGSHESSSEANSPTGAEDHPPPYPVMAQELLAALGEGEPLPAALGRQLESHFDADFSRIRVHDDVRADYLSKALGAEAFSVGGHIALGTGRGGADTPAGRELLTHESGHVAAGQSAEGQTGAASVQLKVRPDTPEVMEEMKGQSFQLRSEQKRGPTTIPKGEIVVVVDWKGKSPTATVRWEPTGSSLVFEVPKLALDPVFKPVTGMRHYTAGVDAQQRAVEKSQSGVTQQRQKVKDWEGKEAQFQKNHDYWKEQLAGFEEELKRQEGVLGNKEESLSEQLLLETMYNRFDSEIVKWVDFYNNQFNPPKKLPPGIVKSMIFHESRMGTHGDYMSVGPFDWASQENHPIKTRFNIMQSVDSSARQQLLMIKEMSGADIYVKYKLNELEKEDKAAAKGLSEAQMYGWRSGALRDAMDEFFKKRAGGKNLMGTGTHDLNLDYPFWIRTGVRWLFLKYLSLPSKSRTWEEAARAYNGSGADAERYKRKVMERANGTGAFDAAKYEREEAARRRKK